MRPLSRLGLEDDADALRAFDLLAPEPLLRARPPSLPFRPSLPPLELPPFEPPPLELPPLELPPLELPRFRLLCSAMFFSQSMSELESDPGSLSSSLLLRPDALKMAFSSRNVVLTFVWSGSQ
jgi:hypothetical protein